MNIFTHFGSFCETSRRFDLSSRSLGHVIFSRELLRKQELVVDRGQLVALFTVHCCKWLPSLFFWSTVALWLALWCYQVKPSARSQTPVGMVRLVCSLKRFPSGRLVSPMYTCAGSWSHVISYMTSHSVFRRLVFRRLVFRRVVFGPLQCHRALGFT